MDRIINTKTEQQSIYEIYRACRLCGAGAGYKMPIIQNVVDLDSSGIELTQKIRDCVQIEVHPDDKMPPLICELCVDKVNDFYDFVELCQRINKRTRMRLGLPPQTSTRVVNSDASSNSGDCILGVTEQVYHNDDSDEPLAPVTRRSKQSEGKLKVIKKDNSKLNQKEHSSKQKRPPTPPRTTRHSKSSSEDSVALSRFKQQGKKPSSKTASPPQPKSILKKDKDTREDSPVPTRSKRPREPPKPEVPQKKVKLAVSSSSTKAVASPQSSKPGPRSRRAPSPPRPAAPEHPCRICGKLNSTSQALGNHLRSHTVQFTSAKLACNACQMWFSTAEEAQAHHKWHRSRHKPYRCRRCGVRHNSLAQYTEHIDKEQCIPWEEVPDVKCAECWKLFPTDAALRGHLCGGADARPGGKCSKCRRVYTLLKNLKRHEATCTHKKKGEVIVDPGVRARIRPAQVRVVRCDALLTRGQSEHYDVSRVVQNYGLDRNCVYPYLSSYVKTELPRDSMVNIKTELDDYEEQYFVHWDSDTESEVEANKTVDSLSTLTLKKIFSKKCLGKIPRKRRKVKLEKNAFDSLLNASEFETTMSRDINNIIDNLGNDEDSWDKNINDKNDDNSNGSEEPSLLTNYVLFDNAMVTNNEKKVNDVENSNDSQSILDTNTDSGNNENVSEENTRIHTYSDKLLDKDSAESDKEEDETVEESEKENVQDISKVSSIENNIESGEIDDRNVDSAEISNDNKMRTVSDNEDDTNKKETSVSSNNDVRIESIENISIEESVGDNIDNDSKQESTNNNRVNSTNDDSKMDFTEGNSVKVSSEKTSNDTGTVNIHKDNTVGNKKIVSNNYSENTNNDSENANDDIENIKNNTDLTNSCNEKVHDSSTEKISNGEVEEKSDKLSFGDMNDISDTELDDKKLMDALNEQIGENDKITEDINGDIATQSTEDNNHETELSNEQNRAKNELPNACENTTELNHKTNAISDRENAINDMIAENNDTVIENNDTLSNDVVSESKDIFSESENINNCETDKISLEDLLPPTCETKSMDLDNISDDDFDFEAC